MNKSRYRLPDSLGGHPVDVVRRNSSHSDKWELVVDTGEESFPICLPPTVLVEAPPPEPPNHSVVLLTDGVHLFDVWARNDHEGYSNGKHWFLCGFPDAKTWDEICAAAKGRGQTLSQLILDPTDTPGHSQATVATAHASQKLHIDSPTADGYIPVHVSQAGQRALISPDGAREAAVALLRGAKEVRERG